MSKSNEVLDFCIRHKTVLSYSLVSLLTAVGEHIFSSVVFKCPCDSGNMLYASIFLIVPAFVLFLFGYTVNTRIWLLLTGSCRLEKGGSCSPRATCRRYCQVLVPVTARALVAPLTWIAVALLGANVYECAASGNSMIKNLVCKDKGEKCHNLLSKTPCDENLKTRVEFLSLQAQSQLIGLFLIAGITTVALVSTCVSHCWSPFSYLQFKFQKIYSKTERELFEIKAKEHATRLAERNLGCFFKATDPAPFQTPSNKDWQMISLLYASSSEEQYYSTLHKYINTKRGNAVGIREEDQNPSVLGLVDEISASESGL
ncbi:calcium homeostasis modulator protein 6 [Pelecanus crispus]|uniref:calcium homeostasis modulator protein 6 n=1 Tax=Pelecanus crispus TaxID=36300 RepID=UPI003F5D3CE9